MVLNVKKKNIEIAEEGKITQFIKKKHIFFITILLNVLSVIINVLCIRRISHLI